MALICCCCESRCAHTNSRGCLNFCQYFAFGGVLENGGALRAQVLAAIGKVIQCLYTVSCVFSAPYESKSTVLGMHTYVLCSGLFSTILCIQLPSSPPSVTHLFYGKFPESQFSSEAVLLILSMCSCATNLCESFLIKQKSSTTWL